LRSLASRPRSSGCAFSVEREPMQNQRGILDRFLSACLGFFVACVLVYVGIQLLRSVLSWLIWLICSAAFIGIVALVAIAMRWRRERW
jgi:ABC-type multidrug transport system permease subunit